MFTALGTTHQNKPCIWAVPGQYILDGECWLPNNQILEEWEMNEDY